MQWMGRRAVGWSVSWVIGWIAVASAFAQTEKPAPVPDSSRAFQDRIEVRVIEVEVVVTDDDGRRVSGLTREDFELYLGDERIRIEYFDEVHDGAFRNRRSPPTADVEEGVEERSRTERPGRSFLIFVDELFSDPRYLGPVLERVEARFGELASGDRAAVVRSLGGSLRLHSDWSSDRNRIQEALRAVREAPRGFLPAPWRVEESIVTEGLCTSRSRTLYREIQRVANDAVTTLWTFADTPGRKVFVLVSGGWPYGQAYPCGTISAVGDLEHLLEFGKWGGVGLLRPVIESANLLGWTVYPVFSSDFGAGSRWASLRSIALRTGGQITGGPTNPRPLDSMLEDLRSYYVLGFTKERAEDEDLRRLKVGVRREGLTTRHRKDLRDPSDEFRQAMDRQRGLLFGPSSSELRIEAGAPEPRGRRVVEVPLTVYVPLDRLTRLPAPEGSDGEHPVATATLHIQAMSAASKRRSDPVEMHFEVPEVAFDLGVPVGLEVRLNLRPTRNRIVVSLEDEASGAAVTGTLDLDLSR